MPRPHFFAPSQARLVQFVWMAVSAVLAAMTLFPLFWMVSIAFKTPAESFSPNMIPAAPTWQNFIYVLTEVPFLRYMFNSFIVSATVTVVALLFHSMAGYALARLRFPGREAIFLAIFSTLLVSLPVIIVPLFIVVKTLGMLNSYAGLIVPAIFNAFGIFLLRQYYLSLPRELEEAAVIDGAGYWRIYWSVVLPLSRPILAALTILFFLANWNSFLWPLTITADSGEEATRLFNALSDGGKIDQPLCETFFASHFGVVTDRFGVSWMICVLLPQPGH